MSARAIPASLANHPRIAQWLGFAEEGVVRLRSGKVELGQGIASALVQVAAEELDVDPKQIRLVAGDTRESPNEGMTAGSRSISEGALAVRYAASAAREVLLTEAAKLLQASPGDLSVVGGLVHTRGRATDLTYWTLARSVDLEVDIEPHAHPKEPSARTVIGRKLARHDIPPKVMGAAFIHDVSLPNMAHGRVLHPPSLGTKLESVEIAALETLPGVVAVVRDGSFLGVVAETEWAALQAIGRADKIVRWSKGVEAPEDAVAAVRATATEPEVVFETGDPATLDGRRFETLVTRPYISHASIGTCCAIAEWQGPRLFVHSHSQGVFPLRAALAQVFDMEAEDIDIKHVPNAGCYGHNGSDDVALDAALLARAVAGRPVRVVWSRASELGAAPLGPAMAVRAQAVIDGDGRIAGWSQDIKSQPHGVRPGRAGRPNLVSAAHLAHPFKFGPSPDVPLPSGGADRNAIPGYAIPAVRVAKAVIQDLPYRGSSLRGLGAYMNVYAIETLMDDIAHELGQDPVAFRLEHLHDERARETVERTAKAAGWPGAAEEGAALGFAYSRYTAKAAYCAVAVRVEVEENVRVTHAWAAVDAGAAVNPDGISNQVEGGLIQAASWTLKEAVRFEGDAVATLDWEAYPILRFSEVPETKVDVIDRPNMPEMGVGECAGGPTGAAISNAVRRALGVRIRDLPLTRDAIIAALA